MSDSVQPHRWQPTRLPRLWGSPGKNTGVGCHCLLQCMKVKSESEVTHFSDSQRPHGLQPSRLLRPRDFPGKSIGVGCHFLPQEVTKIYQIWTQNQANRKDWPEEAQKKCLMEFLKILSSTLPFPGEGDGTPLQYSCLENPMDGGAWWVAVHGVAQSQT